MKILKDINSLKKALYLQSNLGFVPTMGGLHKGHISLIKESQKKCKKTLVSIFINPKQFNKNKDFLTYPKNFKKDLIILKKLKVNLVFLPKSKEIFKKGYKKNFLPQSQKKLCAKYRKGHFEGVLDVMEQFVKIINPKYIFMGKKDFQQIFLVNKYIVKKYNSKIFKCETIRDKNFAALSTRNLLLGNKNLKKVGYIAKNIYKFKQKLRNKKKIKKYLYEKKKELIEQFNIRLEYLEVLNESDLNIYNHKKKFRVFIAYYLNKIRLIDNF